jgi:hypothetical protein
MPYIESVCGPLKCFLKRQKTRETTGNSINEYGASELDLIAFQSRNTETKGEWEINSETLFVEILDDKGAVLPMEKRAHCNHFLIQQSPSVYSL